MPEFDVNDVVQRKDGRRGPPPYRFRGVVCGTYVNPVTGSEGSVVCSYAEPGCIQVFPNEQLEKA